MDDHQDYYVAVFNTYGLMEAGTEACSCDVHQLDPNVPDGCYVTILPIPLQLH